MPHQISVDHQKRIISVELTGELGRKDIMAYISELMEEPYLSMPYGVVGDYSKAVLKDLAVSDISEFICLLKEGANKMVPFHMAVLTSRPLEFGFNRAFEMIAETENLPFKMLVTEDEEQAWQWAMNSPHKS